MYSGFSNDNIVNTSKVDLHQNPDLHIYIANDNFLKPEPLPEEWMGAFGNQSKDT